MARKSTFQWGTGSNAHAPHIRKATSYELAAVGKHTQLVIHYESGKASHFLFESYDDAKANGELALNPPFVRFPAPPININTQIALDAHEAAQAEFAAALDQELDQWQ